MRRYWIPKESIRSDDVLLTGETLHHVRDVCRLQKGSKFEVIVEGGTAFLVEIIEESKKQSRARILETRVIPPLPEPHLILAMSIPRFPVFEAVVEKAVELGVKAIQPFFSEFSFIRTQTDVWDKKIHRFEKIVQSATQQSGRGELMELRRPVSLQELGSTFNRLDAAAGLFAYEGEAVLSARQGLAQLQEKYPREVWIFVGGEGGFSENEVEYFQSMGLQPLTLGAQVLRVETACVALVSVIKYDLDLMR
jgi:16S rRNA (uracil1498-N3)-methyltransferase